MTTRNLVPRNSGEGGVGKIEKAWGSGVFDNLYINGIQISPDQELKTTDSVEFASGNFVSGLTLGGVDITDLGSSVEQIQSEAAEFCFFSNIINNLGVAEKKYHQTPNPNTSLSGVTVSTAEDLKIYFQWDGPNESYMGKAYINGKEIPQSNIQQLGDNTRRFVGHLDNINATGLTGITGSANGRSSVLPLTELGVGPTPVNIFIDQIENATPKAGELLGDTHLKQGDLINIYADFNRNDVDLIKVHDYGLAQEAAYKNYSLEDLGGIYRATIPVTTSNRNGGLSVAIQAIDNFGSTGELKESSDFGHSSGIRPLDQTYPTISASDPATYNGRSDGLRQGESCVFSNTISNWISGADTVSYTSLTNQISINNTGVFESSKKVNYNQGIFNNTDNIEIYAARINNGATDKKRIKAKIANGPAIVQTQLDSSAASASAPHTIGSSELKAGDTVNSKIEINGNGVSIGDLSISVLSGGVSDGSQSSYSSSYTKTTLANGNFEFTVPIKVYGSLGSSSRDGDQSASFKVRNNFGTISDAATTVDTAKIHNGTIPTINFGSITYPVGQQAIKSTESAQVQNTISNFDTIFYTSSNNQLTISNPATHELNKNVDYLSGGYNVEGDGGSNNLTITCTRLSNGVVISSSKIINIANTPLSVNINNLAPLIKTSTSNTSNNFNLTTNQVMLSDPLLSIDPNQSNPSTLNQTASGTGKYSNAYSLTVSDLNTKGAFDWQISARNLANIETTSISSNPNYTLQGFTPRTIKASPNDIAAGLASIGTTVTNANNVTFENISEGGSAANGGTIYTYKSYPNGILLDSSYDFNNKFTICNSSGVTDKNGDYVFNLDKLNRAANSSIINPASFIISE